MLPIGRGKQAVLLDNVLIIFVKYPQPGFVKTRLAKEIGKENAASLYRLFVEAILSRTDDKNFNRVIFYTPAEKRHQIKDWIGSDMDIYPQKGKDLGERLSHAFKFIFEKGAKRAVVIGSDSPTIDKKIILQAFKELEYNECVIGPSSDGGYYLVGLSYFHTEIFKDITWSTNKVYEQTLNRLRKLKLKFSSLDELFDVDNFEDLVTLKRSLRRDD